jgi:hypothetical protein
MHASARSVPGSACGQWSNAFSIVTVTAGREHSTELQLIVVSDGSASQCLASMSAIVPAHLVLYAVLDALMFFKMHRLAIASASHARLDGILRGLLTAVQLQATKFRRML